MTEHPDSIGLGGLNPHEVATMDLVMEGIPNQRIAERLGIAEGDVMRNLATISKKLNVQNRTEAVRT